MEVIADRLRVLGEPAEMPATSRQNVSGHVGILARTGLVAREKHANGVRCRIADETVVELREQVCEGLRRQVAELQTLLGSGGGDLIGQPRSRRRSLDAGGRARPGR